MPDHVHGVVGSPTIIARFGHPPSRALSSIVGSFKAAASRLINADRGTPGGAVSQRNYFEHVVRTKVALDRLRVYIATNPARWRKTTAKSTGS